METFPKAYDTVQGAAAAIVDSMVNENEVCGKI